MSPHLQRPEHKSTRKIEERVVDSSGLVSSRDLQILYKAVFQLICCSYQYDAFLFITECESVAAMLYFWTDKSLSSIPQIDTFIVWMWYFLVHQSGKLSLSP